jgi:N-methylhydantoinase B/oxoprolinase/acetone carboxylase alpha subunit
VIELLTGATSRLAARVEWDAAPMTAVADISGRPIFVSDPAKSPSLAGCGAYVTETFGPSLAPGDAVVSNDPFVGADHVTDFTLVRRGERGIAFARMRMPDVGGFEFGGYAPQSFDTWGEGARFPALRVALGGAPRREGLELVALNSRTPSLVRHGLDAMLETTAELCEALDREGPIDDSPLRSFAAAAESALAGLNRGRFSAESAIECPVGGHEHLVRVELTITDGRARISFARSSPQLEAPLNSPPGHTRDCTLAVLAESLPAFPLAPGALDGVDFDPGSGTITGATPPAITGLAPFHTARAIRGALGEVLRAAGAAGASSADHWWEADGRPAFEARVDPATLRVPLAAARALIDLERHHSNGHGDNHP